MDNEKILEVIKASDEAVTKLEPGYVFVGAIPEAKLAGYPEGTREYELFVQCYYDSVKNMNFRTDIETGAIVTTNEVK